MGEDVLVTVKLPESVLTVLREEARRRGVTVSTLLRGLLVRLVMERYGRLYVTRRIVIRDIDVESLLVG